MVSWTLLWIWSNGFATFHYKVHSCPRRKAQSNLKKKSIILELLKMVIKKNVQLGSEEENSQSIQLWPLTSWLTWWSDANACFTADSYRCCTLYRVVKKNKQASMKMSGWVWCEASVCIHSGRTTSTAGRTAGSFWRTTLWVITSLRTRGSTAAGARCASAKPSWR